MRISTILVIEGDAVLRASLGAAFTGAGFFVELAADEAEGLRAFMAAPPHVVVTNVTSTPGGLGNIIAMKRVGGPLKIVAMSGGDPTGAARCLGMASHLGADRTIAKPFDVADLVVCVAGFGTTSEK